jgi:hypothetical protein
MGTDTCGKRDGRTDRYDKITALWKCLKTGGICHSCLCMCIFQHSWHPSCTDWNRTSLQQLSWTDKKEHNLSVVLCWLLHISLSTRWMLQALLQCKCDHCVICHLVLLLFPITEQYSHPQQLHHTLQANFNQLVTFRHQELDLCSLFWTHISFCRFTIDCGVSICCEH